MLIVGAVVASLGVSIVVAAQSGDRRVLWIGTNGAFYDSRGGRVEGLSLLYIPSEAGDDRESPGTRLTVRGRRTVWDHLLGKAGYPAATRSEVYLLTGDCRVREDDGDLLRRAVLADEWRESDDGDARRAVLLAHMTERGDLDARGVAEIIQGASPAPVEALARIWPRVEGQITPGRRGVVARALAQAIRPQVRPEDRSTVRLLVEAAPEFVTLARALDGRQATILVVAALDQWRESDAVYEEACMVYAGSAEVRMALMYRLRRGAEAQASRVARYLPSDCLPEARSVVEDRASAGGRGLDAAGIARLLDLIDSRLAGSHVSEE